ncbi:MAG: hypothetical protein H7A40_03060 [Chlamydiales bacterium]|nr:hypothetical protein [Chlamydiales bacterium]
MVNSNEVLSQNEKPKIKKSVAPLLDNYYTHPSTSPLTFQFESQLFVSSDLRLQSASIKQASIDEKHLYIIDDFFLPSEQEELRLFSKNASFSRNSYGSPEAIENGEKPAQSMNGKERWQFFSHPPSGITEVYKLFATLGAKINADITTLPWELCTQSSHGSPAVIANKLTEASEESRELGKHQDCNPENRVSFGIPVLYSEGKEFHPNKFANGSTGKPWLISAMVYTTAEEFLPEYRLGTIFYDHHGNIALRANCVNMRLVFFEGDLFHSIEESKIPSEVKTWRTSYVFKLIINPKDRDLNVKEAFADLMRPLCQGENLSLGTQARG